MSNKTIEIEVGSKILSEPITPDIVEKTVKLLNTVFNLPAFKIKLCQQTFVASNRIDLSKEGKEIPGSTVYDDFISNEKIKINLTVKPLRHLWKRYVSKTMGETDPEGNSIVTYTWWLNEDSERKLTIEYATHVGHEIFHTKYLRYIHDPEINSSAFVNERDVTYMIDDILEELITQVYQ